MEKYLGKIIKAEFGIMPNESKFIGLQLTFSVNGQPIETKSKYTENIRYINVSVNEQEHLFAIMIENLYKLLKDAKIDYVSQLINKPVEITMLGKIFYDFRILTEVL